MTDEELVALIPRIVRPEDFAFTVEARGGTWDVYHFGASAFGPAGTLGFAQLNGRWTIGIFCKGHLTKEEVVFKLRGAQG